MAIDKEDDIAKLAESLGSVIAPTSAMDDPQSMLKAIQNAALIRAGIGIMGQRKMGESGYDVASRVLKDVSKDAATQIAAVQKLATTTAKKKTDVTKEARASLKDALSVYDKTFYQKDQYTGALTQLRQDFQELDITPPSQEFFKNNLFTQDYILGQEGQMENYLEFHKAQALKAKGRGEKEPPEWEETFNTYNIIRNMGM
jgi:multidrug efflux pump subunit AcrA (membrane-fusion protein)